MCRGEKFGRLYGPVSWIRFTFAEIRYHRFCSCGGGSVTDGTVDKGDLRL